MSIVQITFRNKEKSAKKTERDIYRVYQFEKNISIRLKRTCIWINTGNMNNTGTIKMQPIELIRSHIFVQINNFHFL